jgi:hypothetical protein
MTTNGEPTETVTDEQIAKLLDPSRVPGITLEYIRTAQQCDFKWEFDKGIQPGYHTKPGANPMIHECNGILGEPHEHMCIDCYLDINGVDGVY